MRFSASRVLIDQEYKKLLSEGGVEHLNIVRTISVRLGYKLDENRNNAHIRRILKQLGYLS